MDLTKKLLQNYLDNQKKKQMTPLSTPTAQQLREFYPVSTSLPEEKINELKNYVVNNIFLEMFGFEVSQKINSGEIENSDSSTFIGFQKFLALCCAYQEIKDPLVSTNFGAKIIDRSGSINPTNNQKSITLIDLEKTISTHYKIALNLLTEKCANGLPNWGGYFSYKIYKL